MRSGQLERCPAKIDARVDILDPGVFVVDGQVGGRDAELFGAAAKAGNDFALHAEGEGGHGPGGRPN